MSIDLRSVFCPLTVVNPKLNYRMCIWYSNMAYNCGVLSGVKWTLRDWFSPCALHRCLMDKRGCCVGHLEPHALPSSTRWTSVQDFPVIKGLISRNGCKALIQILSFLIWLLILMWNDILILFPGISKRKKIPLLLLELHIFFFLRRLGQSSLSIREVTI